MVFCVICRKWLKENLSHRALLTPSSPVLGLIPLALKSLYTTLIFFVIGTSLATISFITEVFGEIVKPALHDILT